MANLINTIPAYKPQVIMKPQQTQQPLQNTISVQSPAVRPGASALATSSVSNPFPQIQTYEYLPARPLSPARTQPKGVRPEAPHGRLVKENIFQSAASTVKSYADYMKYFYNAAFKGEGTDYSVGKINDLAIRAGSLGIAAVLATSKFFPFAKGMEFVGLGTWFASMAIWPQIIGAPIKAKTGVDINQKYIDSYDRRKFVYEDNLYRPMDLYRHVDLNGKPLSEEEYYKKYDNDYVYLDKIGDKLGIPRDINNRHEAIMNKMGQVAVQGKTLWMMTAGIMTPVISSIVADSLQNPIKDGLETIRFKQQSKNLQKLDTALDELLDIKTEFGRRNINTNLEQVIDKLGIKLPETLTKEFDTLLGNGVLSKEELGRLEEFLNNRYLDTGFRDAIDKFVKHDMRYTEPHIRLNDNLKDGLIKATKEAVNEAVGKMNKSFVETLPEDVKNYAGMSIDEYHRIISKSVNDGAQEMNLLRNNSFENAAKRITLERFKNLGLDEDAVDMIEESINKHLKKYMDSQRHYVIPKDRLKQLFRFAETNKQVQQRVEKFEQATIMNIAESMTANNWQKVPQKYLDLLKLTKQEMAQIATIEPSEASKILAKKFEQIVADPARYEEVLQKMSKYAESAISKEEKMIIQLIGTADTPGTLSKVKDLMSSVGKANFGDNMHNALQSFYKCRLIDLQNKLRNTIDSFVRPVKALDTFKHIDEHVKNILGHNPDQYNSLIRNNPAFHMFENLDYETAKKSLKAFLKDAALDKNDINNWTTKFEHNMPGAKRGLKYSLEMVKHVAEVINGDIKVDTASAVGREFAKRCDINNTIMRFRFLNLEYKLAKEYPSERCFMKVYLPAKELVEKICGGNFDKLHVLEGLIDERKAQLSLEEIAKLKELRDTARRGFKYLIRNREEFDNTILKYLDFGASNKEIAEMSGKNVTDFFVNAAQNFRSRNKWTKLAYGLLIGTTAASAVIIAMMGRKNHFNKDTYEYKNAAQGAGKE